MKTRILRYERKGNAQVTLVKLLPGREETPVSEGEGRGVSFFRVIGILYIVRAALSAAGSVLSLAYHLMPFSLRRRFGDFPSYEFYMYILADAVFLLLAVVSFILCRVESKRSVSALSKAKMYACGVLVALVTLLELAYYPFILQVISFNRRYQSPFNPIQIVTPHFSFYIVLLALLLLNYFYKSAHSLRRMPPGVTVLLSLGILLAASVSNWFFSDTTFHWFYYVMSPVIRHASRAILGIVMLRIARRKEPPPALLHVFMPN